MVDQWTLHATAETCAQLHREHSSRLAEKKQAIKTELMMAPHRGPRDVLNINNLSDQDEFIHERRGDNREVPGGLLNMVQDAAFYTSKPHTVFPMKAHVLCDFVREHAYEIAEKFPAVEELHELLQQQIAWLTKHMDQRKTTVQDMQRRHNLNLTQGWGTAAELAPIVSGHLGKTITNLKITEAGRGKKFQVVENIKGKKMYNLQEMIDHFQSA